MTMSVKVWSIFGLLLTSSYCVLAQPEACEPLGQTSVGEWTCFPELLDPTGPVSIGNAILKFDHFAPC